MSKSGWLAVFLVVGTILYLTAAAFAFQYGERPFVSNRALDLYSYPCLTDAPECQFIERAPAGTLYNLYGNYVAHDSLIWAAVDEDLAAWIPVARNGICPLEYWGTGAGDMVTTGVSLDLPILPPPVIRPPDPPAS